MPAHGDNAGEVYTFPLHWLRGGLRRRLRADLLVRLAGPVANAPNLTSFTRPDCDLPTVRRMLREYGSRLPGGAPWTIGELMRDARLILRRPVVAAKARAIARELAERFVIGGAEMHLICRRERRRFRRAQRRASAGEKGWASTGNLLDPAGAPPVGTRRRTPSPAPRPRGGDTAEIEVEVDAGPEISIGGQS
jgi:hypothetical protein